MRAMTFISDAVPGPVKTISPPFNILATHTVFSCAAELLSCFIANSITLFR